MLPGRQIFDGDGGTVDAGPLVDCTQVWAPEPGIGLVTVRSLDVRDGDALLERGRAFGVVANRDTVHVDGDRAYVATMRETRDYRLLAIGEGTDGVLRLAGRLNDSGQVRRVLQHDGGLVVLTDKHVILTDPNLHVRTRLPRFG